MCPKCPKPDPVAALQVHSEIRRRALGQEIGLDGYEIVELGGSGFVIKILLQRGLSTMRANPIIVERWAVWEFGEDRAVCAGKGGMGREAAQHPRIVTAAGKE
ncbi:MAG TPA: hypothetical protein DDY17_03860 [Syntrophaceae bacterium]|jgi:hypothetical protein|nr:hypothetical protein [Syntrophaceae bacterium]